jgi:5-formyltetrahydrofolate cyclo-ligase
VTTDAVGSPGELKRALRSRLIAARARLSQEERARGSAAIAERVLGLPFLIEARTVALYAPLGTEVDALEIARRLGGLRLLYPRARVDARSLTFARCEPVELVRGPLGAREPPAGAPEVELADVDCVVVPGIGFSEDGVRLGRGGGYYDAALLEMPRARRVGVAFEVQLVPTLPHEPHDATLDVVVTEARILRFERELR